MFLRILQAVYANMCSNTCWNVSRKIRLHIVTSCRFEASRDPTLDRWQLAGEKPACIVQVDFVKALFAGLQCAWNEVEMETIVLQYHYITAIFHYNYWKSFGRLFSDLVIHRHALLVGLSQLDFSRPFIAVNICQRCLPSSRHCHLSRTGSRSCCWPRAWKCGDQRTT